MDKELFKSNESRLEAAHRWQKRALQAEHTARMNAVAVDVQDRKNDELKARVAELEADLSLARGGLESETGLRRGLELLCLDLGAVLRRSDSRLSLARHRTKAFDGRVGMPDSSDVDTVLGESESVLRRLRASGLNFEPDQSGEVVS